MTIKQPEKNKLEGITTNLRWPVQPWAWSLRPARIWPFCSKFVGLRTPVHYFFKTLVGPPDSRPTFGLTCSSPASASVRSERLTVRLTTNISYFAHDSYSMVVVLLHHFGMPRRRRRRRKMNVCACAKHSSESLSSVHMVKTLPLFFYTCWLTRTMSPFLLSEPYTCICTVMNHL